MNFDEVEHNFCIGGRFGLQGFLQKYNDSTVSVITVESENLQPVAEQVHKHMFIEVDDVEESDLLSHFDAAHDFIVTGLRQPRGAVFVHCRHGISRSATICAAYLMRRAALLRSEHRPELQMALSTTEATKQMSLRTADAALNRLRECRACVRPNDGFLRQLRLYQEMGMTLCPNSPHFRRHQLQCTASKVARDPSLLVKLATPLLSVVDTDGATELYRCRKCRTLLFTNKDLEPNAPEQVASTHGSAAGAGDGGVFRVLPVVWMHAVLGQHRGAICCHKCTAKLGNFCWLPEFYALREDDLPRFTITKSRVDRCSRVGHLAS